MTITFEDFKKLDIRIGKVVAAEKVEGADKLLKLQVDFDSENPSTGHSTLRDEPSGSGSKSSGRIRRQIVSGIAQFYTPEEITGKLFPFILNLEPRTFRGVESQGMILAATDGDVPVLMSPDKDIPAGSIVR